MTLWDPFSWLTGTTTTKDVNTIKTRINHLISTQQSQQETLVHIISILSVTTYATQINRQNIIILMVTTEKTHQDITTLYTITHSLYSSISYQQNVLHIRSILATCRIHYTTCEKSPYTPWTISMQSLQEYSCTTCLKI